MKGVGLWWWIDRWRKSSSFMDMTLEEQGAYRNLLDEAWLRGGPLPNDERVLAKACGDALAWKRVRAAVMARFTLATDGWRHETLDEVLQASSRRAEKQRRWRKGHTKPGDGNEGGNEGGNETGNAPSHTLGNTPGNNARSPDPDPDLDLRKAHRAKFFAGKRLKVSDGQHQVLVDELGSKVAGIDLPALYAALDADLVVSGEKFDTLVYIKRRALGLVEGATAHARPQEPEVDWSEDCKRRHDGKCGGRMRHHNQTLIDQGRELRTAGPVAVGQ